VVRRSELYRSEAVSGCEKLYRETHTMSNPSLSSKPSTSLRKKDRLLSVISESMSSKTTKHGASRRARSKTCLMPVRTKRDHVSHHALESSASESSYRTRLRHMLANQQYQLLP
jgi:hypothetical protein